MKTSWTPAQTVAIETRNKTLLLSAAAGSGKTSTLTERIIRSITDKESPSDISKMLIVTFTRASAADLKSKIFSAINDALAKDPSNKHLSSQLVKLVSAQISTIDAFYVSAVKKNFAALGLSSSFRIADESETVLIANDVSKEVANYYYDNDSSFFELCECFENVKDTDDDIISQIIISVYKKCLSVPDGVEYLKICADDTQKASKEDFFKSKYGEIVREYTASMFEAYLDEYNKLLDTKMPKDEKLFAAYSESMERDRHFCIRVLNLIEEKTEICDYASLSRLINEYSFSSIGSLSQKNASELSAYCKSLRESFKKSLTKLANEYYCYSSEDFHKFFGETARMLSILYRVVSDFEIKYTEEKKRRNILELPDIKRYAYKLFVDSDNQPTEYAKTLASQYSDIYIDEYQDVDPVQDLIFSCISTPTNRFMVGDIKQSIYRFRDANPQLFADYRAKFPTHGTEKAKNSNAETLYMSENFRCTEKIIDFTNLICANIFYACGDSIGYTQSDDLVYPKLKKDSPEQFPEGPDVNVAIFAKPQRSMPPFNDYGVPIPSTEDAEASYIAYKIKELLINGKKLNGEPIKPCDIAVIYKTNAASIAITNALNDLGIQTTNSDSSQYFQNPDVVMTLCILNAIDNPQRDVHLAGALRSPIFGFTLEELMVINSRANSSYSLYDKLCLCAEEDTTLGKKCNDFKKTLEEWRCICASMPIDKFLRRIFSSEKFVASGLVCEKDEMGRGGNLQTLYEYARTFESGSFKGLYNFIEFINALIENGKTISAKDSNASEECVKLSTIHSSKGLEFPICFVAGCAGNFSCLTNLRSYSFEYGIGMAMSLPDRTGFAKYVSPLQKIIDLYSRIRGVEEEMRVLYVALTRAREQLFITGHYGTSLISTATASAKFNADFNCHYNTLEASSFMDWILPVFFRNNAPSYAKLTFYPTNELPFLSVDSSDTSSDEKEQEKTVYNIELYEKLKSSFSYVYPYASLRMIPAKLSVSKLSPDVLDESNSSVELFDSYVSPRVPDFFLDKPQKASSTERGTATHLFLQFCDFEYTARYGVDRMIDKLIENSFIPSSYGELIYREELKMMLNTDFLSDILHAKKVIREQRFNLLLPSEYFTQSPQLIEHIRGERIAVQGVIDLIVIDDDGNLSLYDYKTDRLTVKELSDDKLAAKKMNDLHGLQLSYYAEAVERLFSKAPKRIAVYSTHAAKLFDIIRQNLILPTDTL